MGAKEDSKPKKFTPEEIQKAYKDAPKSLSDTVVKLLDDDDEGGVFYAHIIQQMCRRFDHRRLPTAGVSVTDKVTLAINPLFWMHVLRNENQRIAVLKHEILHLIFHHCYRVMDFGNLQLANVAADLVVNSQINPKYFGELKTRFIFPEHFGLPHDETLKWYYENYPLEDHPICQTPHKHDEEHAKKSGSTPDEDGYHEPAIDERGRCKECGGIRPMDSHDIWDEEEAEKVSESMKTSQVNDMITRAADSAKSAGNLPHMVRQAIEMAKKQPQIPWQVVLRQFVSKLSTGALTHTKKRISKRYGWRPGPKLVAKLKLLLAVDVSGSIHDEEYKTFLNEGFAILKNMGVDCVDILEWDAGVTSKDRHGNPGPYRLKKNYKVTRTGRGGTTPEAAIRWINENKSRYDGVIFFTDGFFFGDLRTELKVPNLWVITNNGEERYIKQKKYRLLRLPKPNEAA